MESVYLAVSEINIVYTPVQLKDRPIITTSADAHQVLLKGYDQSILGLQEQFVVAFLNQSNRVLGIYRASTGGITGTVADIRLILSVALKVAATSMVLSHSHPSGGLRPSRADEEITMKLKEPARIMDIKVLDHLIIEPSGEFFYSFADEGIL
jgi:DNA repair protein RadC